MALPKLTQIEAKELVISCQATMHYISKKRIMPELSGLLRQLVARLDLLQDYLGKCQMPGEVGKKK